MDLSLPPFLELVPASTEVPSLEMVPWNTWTYLCHHFWSWFLPFLRFHLWRWFLEMHGPISATISGAGDVNNQASTPELVPAFFHGSISRDGSLKYMVLSLPPFLELVVRKASTPELIHAFSTVPSLSFYLSLKWMNKWLKTHSNVSIHRRWLNCLHYKIFI